MRVTRTVTELTGTNESPIGGNFIIDTGRSFVSQNVVSGVSILTNKSTNLSSLVTTVTATRLDANVAFKPGDFYSVTLSSAWTVQNSDGPIVDIECKRCGFSYPSWELTGGLCEWCVDNTNPR
jgi:hypothetical protein